MNQSIDQHQSLKSSLGYAHSKVNKLIKAFETNSKSQDDMWQVLDVAVVWINEIGENFCTHCRRLRSATLIRDSHLDVLGARVTNIETKINDITLGM